ncbi:MAG: RraA family protein [Oscillospiraceae bacterium]
MNQKLKNGEAKMERYYLYGVINQEIERPDMEKAAILRDFSVSQLAKITEGKGLLDSSIHALSRGTKLFGPACTAFGRQGDTLMLQRIGDVAKPGDVIVADAAGSTSLSVIGERIGYYMYKIRKCAGIIIDGAFRDTAGLVDLGVPFFGRGADPKLFGAIGPGAINVTISCGGVVIHPGDLMIGDDDGIIAIPRLIIDDIVQEVEEYKWI